MGKENVIYIVVTFFGYVSLVFCLFKLYKNKKNQIKYKEMDMFQNGVEEWGSGYKEIYKDRNFYFQKSGKEERVYSFRKPIFDYIDFSNKEFSNISILEEDDDRNVMYSVVTRKCFKRVVCEVTKNFAYEWDEIIPSLYGLFIKLEDEYDARKFKDLSDLMVTGLGSGTEEDKTVLLYNDGVIKWKI